MGLSLSYDITKAHGGELKVETVEGEYTEFIKLVWKMETGSKRKVVNDKTNNDANE